MAPISIETAPAAAPIDELKNLSLKSAPVTTKPQWFSQTGRPESEYPYKALLPIWDFGTKYPALTEFTHADPGLEAKKHADPRAFLSAATVDELTPRFGSEVRGVQLTELDAAGRQQLALFVAQRGVVVFRDQDFVDADPAWHVRDWGTFFGRPHIHPVSGHPKGIPEFHLVYRAPKAGEDTYYDAFTTTLNGVRWHSDVTYELQPPGLTALFLYDSPPSGGDTGYADQREAYNRLSPSFAAYLETLQVLHSGVAQAEVAKKHNAPPRREPVENVHPLVRRHPVTGEKALFVNRQFSRHIVGLKQEESDAILNLLYDHIEKGSDFQVRLRWEPRSVVLWDNRITAHNANVDFDNLGFRRHGARITPQAERPFL
ncbi:TauD-domain-containing protein [Cutaneotrichosporon oleaginosum]|uniref:TauD-domain-containing protein n=1 Tax=Cutaneotrichosporon oleaginosum TaxID=879819 RepID=A0A0J0XJV3_9TREE|nr:TauD-domain-containing protein [Cutaneotrichosporon oleaginosum]KLT41377.1 TauD-domain-containing protein [Cutaneotrichosporon oleaginosum]TXT06319.1 hypothetical protein COLE_05650 [Cutaneotrichosporon oleaginosum]